MRVVVEILATILTSGIGVAALVLFSIRQRVHRSNRLTAGRRSGAPASWLWSPRRAAALHRRLQGCCTAALQVVTATGSEGAPSPRRRLALRRRPRPAPGPFERLAAEVVAQAVDLDARLVAADRRTGTWRRQALSEITAEVRRLETSTHRMEALARTWQAQLTGGDPLSPDLGERLDALEAALGELQQPGSPNSDRPRPPAGATGALRRPSRSS